MFIKGSFAPARKRFPCLSNNTKLDHKGRAAKGLVWLKILMLQCLTDQQTLYFTAALCFMNFMQFRVFS